MPLDVFGDKQEFGGENHSGRRERPLTEAMNRGFFCRCPACGKGALFSGYIQTVDRCAACGEEIHHHRADDFPAYLVIVIVGHVIIGAWLGFKAMTDLSVWTHLAIWAPLTIVLALALLRPVKGAVVGMQWALYMHGFSGKPDQVETYPEL